MYSANPNLAEWEEKQINYKYDHMLCVTDPLNLEIETCIFKFLHL